ncbi:MAG: rRNA maturation RNase YbeY [Gemmatimonadota bacterium]|nr:rRNA maturation RNase YbeY [Gemmatimonadota bacterium]
MSIAVDVSRESVRAGIPEARVREIVREVCRRERVKDALISVTFVTNRRMARMNREFLGHKGATDVITFEFTSDGIAARTHAPVGDVYIAPDVARANAKDNGVRIRAELVRLVVHGTLHVLGHSHDDGDGRMSGDMWRRQERIVAALT